MMFTTLAALSAALALPTLQRGDARDFIRSREMATEADDVRAGISLFVAPDGDVLSCTPIRVVGSVETAKSACKFFERRRVSPARDSNGQAIHGVLTTTVALMTEPGSGQSASTNSLSLGELPDIQLPFGTAEEERIVTTIVLVEPHGKVSECEVPSPHKQEDEDVNHAICDYLATVPLHVLLGKDRQPVRYVRRVQVQLTG
ncbi:hypothetical protein [uncultured Erythrobacter sp.]|uniref:hypothetical protein n=1 Tax=uncultured Erythrobacter sp. TaxID=263913 RepID=UPI0026180356|nr:hypothetical protein [uncultured Erythrobacter sp.]